MKTFFVSILSCVLLTNSLAQKPDATAIATFIKFVAERDDERGKDSLSAVSAKLSALSERSTVELKSEIKPVLQALLARNTG